VSVSLSDAESRSVAPPYEVYRPAGLSRAKAVPLVIGIGGSLTKNGSGFNGFADRYGFVVAYPDPNQINVPPNEDASQTARIKYLSDLIDELKVSQNIDPKRVYATGASRSAIESYRVACRLSSKVAAIGSVAGSLLPKDAAICEPSRPISVVEIHGTADAAVPYNGNKLYPPVRTTIAFWLKADGCPGTPTTSVQGPVTTETWAPCKANTAVRLVTYAGGAHGWPRNQQIDATAQLWSFFSAHSSVEPATPTATLNRLTVVRTNSRRALTIRLTVRQAAVVRASISRASHRYATKLFHVVPGTRSLRLGVSTRAPAGLYQLKLVLAYGTGSKQTILKAFRLRP
jgi:polyhydroxybutyrate depolymerase